MPAPATSLARALLHAVADNTFGPLTPGDQAAIETAVKKAYSKLLSNIRRRSANYSVDLLPYSLTLHDTVADALAPYTNERGNSTFNAACYFTYRHILNLRKQGALFTDAQPKPTNRTNGTRPKARK